MVSVILTMGMVLWASLVGATVRYVATDGSDANSCAASTSISTPKLTLVSAKACMVGGDELIIRGGTYTGSSNHLNSGIPSGTAGAPTKYTAYPGEVPIIRPTLPSGSTFALQLFNDSYVTFTGLHIDGSEVTRHTIRIGENSDNVIIQDGDITDQHKGLSTGDWDLGSSCISGAGSPTSKPDNVQILNNYIHDCGYNAFDHGIYPSYGDSWTIKNNEITGMSGYGLHIYPYSTNWLIEDNYIHDNCAMVDGSCGQVVLSESGHVFINNVVSGRVSSSSPNCVQVQYGTAGGDDMQIDNNTLYNCGSVGVYIAATANNTRVRNNHIIGPATAVSNLGTSTTQTTNRSTGSLTDCTVSTTDFTQKSGSSCINAGTVISGRLYSGSAPDQGAFESFGPVSATINGHSLDVTFDAVNTPMSSVSSSTGWTVACSASCGGAPVVGSVQPLSGSANVLRADISGIGGTDCVAGKTWTVSFDAATGTIQDSALMGNTDSGIYRNQRGFSFTSFSVTNNCSGAPTGYPGTPYIYYNMNDGNGTTLVNSGSAGAGGNGSVNGATWGTGHTGSGVVTAASSTQYIGIPYGNGVNPTSQSFTIAFAVKVPAGTESTSRGEAGVSVGSSQRWHVQSASGTWRLGLQGSSANASASNLAVQTDWNHFCITNNAATDTATIYLNGVAGTGGASKTATSSYSLTSNFTLGLYDINTAPGGTYDEFLLYQTVEDCAAIYAAFQPPSSATGVFAQAATRFQGVHLDTALAPFDFGTTINQSQEVVANGAAAFIVQIHCQAGVDCEPSSFPLQYAINGSSSWVDMPDTETSDEIWSWGTARFGLNNGATSTRLTGSCAVTNGSTVLTATQIPTVDLPADGCVMLRYIVRVGSTVGNYYDLRVRHVSGLAFTGGYQLARITIVNPRASGIGF